MDQDNAKEKVLEQLKIIDKAINLEKNAQVFYAHASEHVDSVEGKKTFRWLADFEASHESKLMSKRREVLEDPSLAGSDPPRLNLDLEISESGSGTTFDPGISDIDILILALDNEKRAKAFYERKSAHLTDGPLKELMMLFAREEDKHIRIIQGQIDHVEVNRKWATLESIVGKTR